MVIIFVFLFYLFYFTAVSVSTHVYSVLYFLKKEYYVIVYSLLRLGKPSHRLIQTMSILFVVNLVGEHVTMI